MWPRIKHCMLGGLVVVAGLGLIPIELLTPIDVGLDPSWRISINLAVLDGRIFGRDYLSTCGPLGYLFTRVGIGIPLIMFTLYDIWVWAQLMWVTLYMIRRGSLLTSLLFVFALIITPPPHYLIAAFCGMLFLALTEGIIIPFCLAGLSALLCLYIKVNYGIALSVVWIGSVFFVTIWRQMTWQRAVPMITSWFLLLLLTSYFLNVDLPGYLIGSLHIISGYNDAMVIPIQMFALMVNPAWGLLMVLVLLFLCQIKSLQRDHSRMIRYAITILCAFLLFKNAFVRADSGHIGQFYEGMPLTIGLLAIFERRWNRRILIGLMTVSIGFAVAGPHLNNSYHFQHFQARIWPKKYFVEMFDPKAIAAKCNYTPEMKSHLYIPPHIMDKIRKGTVDVVPFEIAYAYRNQLRYNPRPVPQSYQALNSYLDGLNANKYRLPDAPDFILYNALNSIDQRHPFWDESITKRVMLTNYQLTEAIEFDEEFYLKRYADVAAAVAAGKIPGGRWHYDMAGRHEGRPPTIGYLVRREQPLKTTFTKQSTTSLEIGKPFLIDNTGNLLYMFADVQYTLLGRLRSLLFQSPPLFVELTYMNGTRTSHRAVKPILKTGVLLNKKINNYEEAIRFFQTIGRDNMDVKSIQFTTPSPHYFHVNIPVEIWRLQVE